MNREGLISFINNFITELTEAGDALYQQSLPELTEELFSGFERTGNRLSYENVYFHRRKFLSVFGILAILYGRKRDLCKLEAVIQEICQEECWALPAHVDRRADAGWRTTIDLFAAETAFSLAEILGRLEGKISQDVYKAAVHEVFRRVLSPFMNSKKPYAWWECADMNWCAVCNGSIGGAAIWLLKDKNLLDDLLARIGSSIMNYLDGFSEDGACLEGIGYYTYGMSYFVAFADLVYEYSGGRICLTDSDKFRKIAQFQQKCFLPGGYSLSFSDSSEKETFRMGLTAYLALLDKEVRFPDLTMAAGLESDSCYRYIILSRDLFFSQRYCAVTETKGMLQENISVPFHTVLASAQWSVCCSSDHVVLAAKGGHNAEPHNHNDVGSFIYAAGGQQILADLGAGEYTQDYFNENRYEALCCRSLGHNVPVIARKEQYAGREYRASFFAADGRGRTVIGMEPAYGLDRDETITRTILFDLDQGDCRITDEFCLHPERSLTENFVSLIRPEQYAHGFYILAANSRYQIHSRYGTGFKVIPQRYHDHAGTERNVWLMQWEVEGDIDEISITNGKKEKIDED